MTYETETARARYDRLSALAGKPPKRDKGAGLIAWLMLALVIVVILLPIAYSVATSFKPRSDIALGTFWPTQPTMENWGTAFATVPLTYFIRNSIFAAVFSAMLTLALTVPATYAMVRLGVGRRFLPDFTVATYLAPPVVALIPLFIMLQRLNLTDSLIGMTLVYGLMNIPVAFWLMRGFVAEIPRSVDEAAWLDGAGYWRSFLTVTVPLLLPAFIATGLICAVLSFNEFLFASTMTFGPHSRTLTVGISLFQGERFVNFGQMAAASLSGMIPIYFVAILVQKWLIGGLAHGSVK
ncbi:carbohydrate ABC transporter permease [Oricola sp.]|uniref:carbohydrate ABC transporter permease n=1 Tax=Oricola sp. TaxID=1979950 RepID=UPI003BAA478A